MKFDSDTLEIQYMWNISLKHHQISDSFIVCGVMYAVDHVDERNTKIRFALDLYKNKLLDLELPFTNPFSYTTMLGYNSRIQVNATDQGEPVHLFDSVTSNFHLTEFDYVGWREPAHVSHQIPRDRLQGDSEYERGKFHWVFTTKAA